jgi:hypothetical protein
MRCNLIAFLVQTTMSIQGENDAQADGYPHCDDGNSAGKFGSLESGCPNLARGSRHTGGEPKL